MNGRFKSPVVLATLLVGAISVSLSAQVTFRGFGVRDAYINDMAEDGSVAVGIFVDVARATTAFRWTSAGGVEEIGGLMDVVSISRDGRTIVGAALDSQGIVSAAIWMGGKNWRTLGGVPGGVAVPGSAGKPTLSEALGVSRDGSVIVGSARVANVKIHGFRWDALNGMVDLGALKKDESSVAVEVSANGSAIIGYDSDPSVGAHVVGGRRGIVIVDGSTRLIHPYGWAGQAFATNDVGSTIVGRGHPGDTAEVPSNATTWRWSAWDGRLEDLGAVWQGTPGTNITEYASEPRALSDTGEVVVGATGFMIKKAYIWTAATGMMNVADYLTSKGVTTHNGWDMRLAGYVSPNGKVIVGSGFNPQLIAEAWIVTLP